MNAQAVEKQAEIDLGSVQAPANTDLRTDPAVFSALDPFVREMQTISPAVYHFLNTSFGIKALEPNPVDISILEPGRLLKALYDAARTRRNAGAARELTETAAAEILQQRSGRVNFLAGKELWVNLNAVAGYVDSRWYDFWNGTGRFQEVVDKLKAS